MVKSWSSPYFSVLIALTLSTTVAADFQKGVLAYERGDYQTAYHEFYELAQQGHVDAQNNLGVLYYTGRGVTQDYLAAARWYQRAARQGHGDAQNNLAALYINGYGVPQDHSMAYAWFNQAALQGVSGASQQRDLIAQQLSPEQISRARQLTLVDAVAGRRREPGSNDAVTGYYGPVKVGETLWTIANKVKPVGVGTRVMVNALIRANPEAFTGPAPAGLKINARLKIPLEGEVVQFSAVQVAP
jgi:hypothetical protein